MLQTIYETVKEKMEASIQHLVAELASIRAGRASTSLLDKVKVDYYGTISPLSQVATLSVPDARQITVQPWEASLIPEIEKAIRASELNLNPSNDGKLIRIAIPTLTEERRKELVKLVRRVGEDSKVQLRNCRREGNDEIKSLKSEISEDDARKAQDDIQKLTDIYVKKVDEQLQKKEKDMMEV